MQLVDLNTDDIIFCLKGFSGVPTQKNECKTIRCIKKKKGVVGWLLDVNVLSAAQGHLRMNTIRNQYTVNSVFFSFKIIPESNLQT